jgi:hypothetical protein
MRLLDKSHNKIHIIMFSMCYPILNKSVVLILIIIEAFMIQQLICNFRLLGVWQNTLFILLCVMRVPNWWIGWQPMNNDFPAHSITPTYLVIWWQFFTIEHYHHGPVHTRANNIGHTRMNYELMNVLMYSTIWAHNAGVFYLGSCWQV